MSTTPDLLTPRGSTPTGVFADAAGSPTPVQITTGAGSELPLGVGGAFPPVLDACCGSRGFWFDKQDGRALFVDVRRESVKVDDRQRKDGSKWGGWTIHVNPDVQADFADLPFPAGTFALVVFDPPHRTSLSGAVMAAQYGGLTGDWREMLRRGFAECFRVLRPEGTLIFKWNDKDVLVREILALTDAKPLFGHKSGKQNQTHWIAFLKGGGGGSETSHRHSESGNR